MNDRPMTTFRLDVPRELVGPDGRAEVARLLHASGLAETMSIARRVMEQGGVYVGEDRIGVTDYRATVPVRDGMVIGCGLRRRLILAMAPTGDGPGPTA
jgi:tyrosyl-tRNA synthetase